MLKLIGSSNYKGYAYGEGEAACGDGEASGE